MHKQTGRTTRMLEEAIQGTQRGRYTVVVCATLDHAYILHEKVLKMGGFNSLSNYSPKVQSDHGGVITFETPESAKLDWRTMCCPGVGPTCIVFVDHWTIEYHLAAALQDRKSVV